MQLSHRIRPVFDDPNLVSTAGLVPALRLAESAGLYGLLDDLLSVESPNATAKMAGLVGGMLAGANSIERMDLLGHGGRGRLFAGVRAPSTLGTFLGTFTHGHVLQLDAAGARLLAGLVGRVPGYWPAQMPMTPFVRFMAMPSRAPRSATPGCVG